MKPTAVLKSGQTSGVWCLLGEPLTTVQIARAGFDWVCLDAQHGAFDDTAVVATIRALSALPVRPPVAVRVAELSDAAIGRALDVGADIVIVPMIETVDQAEAAVRAANYPPRGRRSWGPLAALWGGEAPAAADARTELWVMIETRAGLESAESILAVDGVTGVFVGPVDLSLALGTAPTTLIAADAADDPLPSIAAAARRAGTRTGIFAGDPTRIVPLRALGFDAVAVTTDSAILALGSAAALGFAPSRA